MAVDLRKVKKLIELAQEASLVELEVASEDESVRIVMQPSGVGHAISPAPSSIPSAAPVAPNLATSHAELESFEAPMAGTFYAAPSPEAEPFVTVGAQIQPGDILCIIESMKMMHEIRAAQAGTVGQICVANGQPISTGDVLFRYT